MIWYRVSKGDLEIMEAEVERVTEQSVYLKRDNPRQAERRNAKRSEWYNYFETPAQARAFIMEHMKRELDGARSRLESAEQKYAKVCAGIPIVKERSWR